MKYCTHRKSLGPKLIIWYDLSKGTKGRTKLRPKCIRAERPWTLCQSIYLSIYLSIYHGLLALTLILNTIPHSPTHFFTCPALGSMRTQSPFTLSSTLLASFTWTRCLASQHKIPFLHDLPVLSDLITCLHCSTLWESVLLFATRSFCFSTGSLWSHNGTGFTCCYNNRGQHALLQYVQSENIQGAP
jgi:hypothetical protein